MEKYLRMNDVFKSELFIDSDCDDVIVDDLSLTVLESFSGSDAAKFAIHAINSHDELVAMNKELLAAIECLLDDMRFRAKMRGDVEEDGCVILDCGSGVLMKVDSAIAKARAAS